MAEVTIQTTILRNLLHNEEYTRRVVPFLKKEYFEGAHRAVFDSVVHFVSKYNKLPTPEALSIEIADSDVISPDDATEVSSLLDDISEPKDVNQQWLEDQTEQWCQDRAIYLAIMESINIIDGRHQEMTKNALPDLLKDALSVSFDTSVGHDYINDSDERYEFYHRLEERIPFDLDYMNRVTKGGLPKKSLNIGIASTGVGKSMFMCHHAASILTQGKNVLYITLEMAEERIAERIDANLLNIPIDQIENLSYDQYSTKIDNLAKRNIGKLIIKEYPTGAAHSGHFRALMEELKLKRDFAPDIIFIDYLNICSSARMRGLGGSINTYSLIKSIAEEIRGLAIEFDLPIVTATQSNRDGFGNSDVDLNNTSESFGVPATADFMFALIATEELDNLGQIMIKQLKNRYSDPTKNKRFVVGVDKSKMRFYDAEDSAQTLVNDSNSSSAPVFDSGSTASRLASERKDFSGVTV